MIKLKPGKRRPSTESGFSLVEGLVAIAVLLIVVIGIIPLFTQAMASNAAGRHLTQVSNITTDGFETFLQMPLNNDLLTIPAGSQGAATIQLFTGRLPESGTSHVAYESNVQLASFTTGIATAGQPSTEDLIATARSEGGAAAGFTAVNLQRAEWVRQIIVRQYQITSLSDGIVDEADSRFEQAEQLAGGTGLGNIHLKKVDITILPQGRANTLTLGRGRMTSTVVKSF